MKTKSALLFILCIASLTACSAGRRAYYSTKYKIVRFPTGNMIPTIKPGDYGAIDMGYYSKHPVERFDIVILRNPEPAKEFEGADSNIIERVVGLSGETIRIQNGKVYINQQELKEPFPIIPGDPSENFGPVNIPVGEYFLIADNRPESVDSRLWPKPTVNKSYFQAKVVEILPENR